MSGSSTASDGDTEMRRSQAVRSKPISPFLRFLLRSLGLVGALRLLDTRQGREAKGARRGRRYLASKYPAYSVSLCIPTFTACVFKSPGRKG